MAIDLKKDIEEPMQKTLAGTRDVPTGRVVGGYSLHEKEKPELCPFHHSNWRVVFCNDVRDVIECSRCGKQREVACNFDDEYS